MFCSLLLAAALGFALSQWLPPFYVQDIELIQMSKAMRDADDNKAHPGQIYINYQGQAEGMQDNAPSEFFYYVDPAVLQKPSYSQFIAMMNNFNREGGVDEPRVSREEEGHEISTFLTTILASRPWQILYSFLYHKGHPFAQSPYIFRAWIEHLWFRHYSRSRGWAHDSSAFEHVFMGEEKRGEVSGFHNWVRFYLLERNPIEELDYMGFIEGRGNVMVSLRFTWQGLLKRVGSFMVGTSPEFEMALYTLCFLARRGGQECTVEIDGCLVIITSYDMVQDGEIFIGTAYPKAGAVTNTCGNFYRRGY
ncbi:hypothetical protein Y032_0053g2286 [Ancylostoma ceylanicum]|uniref:EndoU domain-containing protein n=1 Tax=Ancylostoma ceylanicum TaxID=53326 RepID=A0A016U7D4_9BILA|nr:hypothetical protein Y032_0053g2286 [Ancylostoma ceylanicum]